jgi:hypothetical protein
LFGTATEPGGPGEAVFAPADTDAGELSGWYLSYVQDLVRDGSDLVIIDATDFQGKPIARVQLPRRMPYGFHGNWRAGCGFPSFPAARTEYGSCDIQREPALEITSRKNYLEGG